MGGRGSLSKTGGFSVGDSTTRGGTTGIDPISNITHNDVYREVKQGISRYHSVMGVRQREVKLADLAYNVNGKHVTINGVSDGVYLNKTLFNNTKQYIGDREKLAYNNGWLTRTNKPIQHTITHELAHATWNEHLTAKNALNAGKEIDILYNKWKRDNKKKGYGEYALHNVSEFWAETTTKAVHGNSDKYTFAVKRIAKKYKL